MDFRFETFDFLFHALLDALRSPVILAHLRWPADYPTNEAEPISHRRDHYVGIATARGYSILSRSRSPSYRWQRMSNARYWASQVKEHTHNIRLLGLTIQLEWDTSKWEHGTRLLSPKPCQIHWGRPWSAVLKIPMHVIHLTNRSLMLIIRCARSGIGGKSQFGKAALFKCAVLS